MNVTFCNSTPEVVGQLFLCGTTFSVCSYAIFLCHAIYDYQEEKPSEEKSPIDFLVKDLMHSAFWLLYYLCLVVIISLFSPPIISIVAYLISYIAVFLIQIYITSLLVLLYIQHVYTFYQDEFVNVDVSIMRQKSIMWKFILTLSSLFLSYLFPSLEVPMVYQILAKGANYDR
jgi:hypothetical protein